MKVCYAVFDGNERVSDKFSTRSMAVHEAYRIKPDWLVTRNDYVVKEITEKPGSIDDVKELWFKEGNDAV